MQTKHAWEVDVGEAKRLQEVLQQRVRVEPLSRPPRLIAGVDVSMQRFSNHLFGGVVVMSYPDLAILETACAEYDTKFPYIPGYLSFREIPVLQKAFQKLRTQPDLICVDGQGIAHPRRFGIASHLGVLLDVPTIGFAKSLLYGNGKMPDGTRGSFAYLYQGGDILGARVRTKDNVTPMIISPGHRITVDESIKYALTLVRMHRIPEPTRNAHTVVNEYRRASLHC